METKILNELKDLLTHEKHGNLYDFICTNYYLLSKEELKDFTKEIIALLYERQERLNCINRRDYDDFASLHNDLLDYYKDNTTLFEE